jgi:hypothetical protein
VIRIDYTQLRISNHTTYVALNPCICQLATRFLKTRSGSRQPRAHIHHRPASCHGGYTLLSPSLHSHCMLSYSGISLSEAKLTHDEACDQLKGPRSASLHRPARSQLYHFNLKFGTWQRYIFSDVEPIMVMMDPPSSFIFENIPPILQHHLL